MLFFIDSCATFRAEFSVGLQRCAALRARCAYTLPPALFLEHGAVPLGHLRVSPDLFHGPAGLGCRHFDAQIGRALLAETFRLIPAAFPADPGRASGTLHEILTKFLHGFFKRFVMSFFPCGRAGFFAEIGYLPQKAAEKTACRIKRAGYGSEGRCLKPCPVSCAAPVAVKFELESLIGALIGVIAGELYFCHGL